MKRDDPLKLDMDPDEAFERFLGVMPQELPEHVRLRQGKGPPKRASDGRVPLSDTTQPTSGASDIGEGVAS